MLRNLTQLEVRNPAVDANVAHSIKELSLFAVSAPSTQQFADAIALFSFPQSTARVVQQLFDQCTVRRELCRLKVGESQIADDVCGSGIFCKFGDLVLLETLDKLGRLIRILNLPVTERGERVDEVKL